MVKIVEAIYDGAVLRPTEPLAMDANTKVRVTVETLPIEDEAPASFLATARSLQLEGPADWSANLDHYLYGDEQQAK